MKAGINAKNIIKPTKPLISISTKSSELFLFFRICFLWYFFCLELSEYEPSETILIRTDTEKNDLLLIYNDITNYSNCDK